MRSDKRSSFLGFNIIVVRERDAKLEDRNIVPETHTVSDGDQVKIGNFTVEFFHVCHSVSGAFAISIDTKYGTVFHTGDFKGCIDNIRTAEELILDYDDRATVSVRDVGAEAGTAVTNLNTLPYRGFCRDRIATERLAEVRGF